MRSFKTILLAGASALLAAASITPASAADIFGGGSSLIAPYIAQAYLCHVGLDTTRATLFDANGNAKTIATPTGTCGTGDSTSNFSYLTSGSGAGQRGLFSQNSENLQSTLGAILPSVAGKTGVINSVEFAASDAALTSNDVGFYTSGAISPATFQGVSFSSPQSARGNLIQIPLSIDPVAIAYNTQYKNASGQTFNLNITTTKLKLDKATLCGIFNGVITNWNQVPTSLNGGNTFKNSSDTTTFNAPLTVVRRSDNSGTTSILTHHLADVCASTNSHAYYSGTNFYTTANLSGSSFQQLPSSVQALSNVVGQSGSGAVGTTINSTAGALGYIGSDFVVPNNANTNALPGISLNAASLQEAASSTSFLQPTASNAQDSFNAGAATPPSGSAQGTQTNWVPLITDPSAGYPLIGTTNGLFYTTYDAGTVAALTAPKPAHGGDEGFLTWYYDDAETDPADILSNAGLARLPTAWNDAITDAFVVGNAQNLQITTP